MPKFTFGARRAKPCLKCSSVHAHPGSFTEASKTWNCVGKLTWVKWLRDAFVEAGPAGLVSSRRGKPSNRRLAQSYRDQVLDIVRARYAGFGPTLSRTLLENILGQRFGP